MDGDADNLGEPLWVERDMHADHRLGHGRAGNVRAHGQLHATVHADGTRGDRGERDHRRDDGHQLDGGLRYEAAREQRAEGDGEQRLLLHGLEFEFRLDERL